MLTSKFGIGQQVRHKLSDVLGVIIDVDAEYSLKAPTLEEAGGNESLRQAPRYYVVMEDDEGTPVHTYVAEIQLSGEVSAEHPEQPSMDELAASVRQQLKTSHLCH